MSSLDAISIWFFESSNFLAVFKAKRYPTVQLSAKTVAREVGGSEEVDESWLSTLFAMSMGLSPSGLAYLKDLEKQKSTGSVMSASFQPTHIQLCPKPMLEWRWLGSCC